MRLRETGNRRDKQSQPSLDTGDNRNPLKLGTDLCLRKRSPSSATGREGGKLESS